MSSYKLQHRGWDYEPDDEKGLIWGMCNNAACGDGNKVTGGRLSMDPVTP